MRILHIGKYYPPFAGGIENFMADLLVEQQRTGMRPAALVHAHEAGHGRQAHPEEGRGVPVYRVPCWGTLLYAPVCPGFPVMLKRVVEELRPEILHIHMPNTSAFYSLLWASARQIPWVVHWHADVVVSKIDRKLAMAYQFYKPLEQQLLKRATAVIATSQAYLDASYALSPWRSKCRVVPLGLAKDRVKKSDQDLALWAHQQWGEGRQRIIAVGRLTYYKGHEILIRSAKSNPDAKILIVGDGDGKKRLQRLIDGMGVTGRVTLLNLLPEAQLHALIESADCLCLPSVERTEAFGLVLLEAMRFGVPVVASNVPGSGMGWVVDDQKTGLLVPPGNIGALTQAFKRLFCDTILRERMRVGALERFDALFQIQKVADGIRSIYQEMLASR